MKGIEFMMETKNWQQSIVDFFAFKKRRTEQGLQKIDQYKLLSISELMARFTDQDIEIDHIKTSRTILISLWWVFILATWYLIIFVPSSDAPMFVWLGLPIMVLIILLMLWYNSSKMKRAQIELIILTTALKSKTNRRGVDDE